MTTVKGTATLRDSLKIIFRHKAAFITPVIILMLTVYIGLNLYTPYYTAEVKMSISGYKPTVVDYYRDIGGQLEILLRSSGETVTSNSIIERAVSALGLYALPLDYEKRFAPKLKGFLIDYKVKELKLKLEKLKPEKKQALMFGNAMKELKRKIKVEPIKGTNMFTITVTDFSPNGAIIIANVISRIYLIYDLERQIAEFSLEYGEKHPLTKQVKDKIDEMQKYLDGRPLTDIEALGPASVKIMEQAKDAVPVVRYNKKLLFILTFLLSLILGTIFAIGSEYLDQTFRSPEDIETFLNIPFLGSIPRIKSKYKLLLKGTNPAAHYVQFYQNLTDQIYLLIKDRGLRSVLIADAESSEDTTFVVANICLCLARKEPDQKILIIDANLRNPLMPVSKIFDVSSETGLADVLEGRVSFEDAVKDSGANLTILPAGKIAFDPATLLGSSRMSDLIKTAVGKYDIIFLTCADLKNFTDSVTLSSVVDALLFVINEGKIRRHVVKFAIAPLEQRKANFLGAILNNRKLPIPKLIYNRL